MISAIYDYLYSKSKNFKISEIVNLFAEKPWLKLINKDIKQKKVFSNLKEELEEAIEILDLQDLKKSRDIIKQSLINL